MNSIQIGAKNLRFRLANDYFPDSVGNFLACMLILLFPAFKVCFGIHERAKAIATGCVILELHIPGVTQQY